MHDTTANPDAADPPHPAGADMTSIVYHVDDHDRIVWIGSGWTAFAEANDAAALVPEMLLQQPLRTWITGPGTWNLYAMLLHRVRRTGEPLSFPFRCDAPARRRFLTMTLSSMTEGGVSFDSRLVRAEARDPVMLLDRQCARSDQFVMVCSWCKRVKVSSERWLEVEGAVEQLGLFAVERLPQLTHGICPDCAERLIAVADA